MCLLSFLVLWSCFSTVKTVRACPVLCFSAGENAEQMGFGKRTHRNAHKPNSVGKLGADGDGLARSQLHYPHVQWGLCSSADCDIVAIMIRRKSTECHKIMPTTMHNSKAY